MTRSKLQQAKNRKWEDLFAFHLQSHGLGKLFDREVTFIPGRRFRLDFADPVRKIGIEIQGAVWSQGKQGHNWGTGINRDHEKMNLGHLHDWRIFQFTSDTVKSMEAIDLIRRYYVQKLGVNLSLAVKSN